MFTGRIAAIFAAMFSGLGSVERGPLLRDCSETSTTRATRGRGRGNGAHSLCCVAMDRRAAMKKRNQAKHREAVRKKHS